MGGYRKKGSSSLHFFPLSLFFFFATVYRVESMLIRAERNNFPRGPPSQEKCRPEEREKKDN